MQWHAPFSIRVERRRTTHIDIHPKSPRFILTKGGPVWKYARGKITDKTVYLLLWETRLYRVSAALICRTLFWQVNTNQRNQPVIHLQKP